MSSNIGAAVRRTRIEQAAATRTRILLTAERLFAEQGVFAVSNRQISEAAGQGNNAAVGYHFGTKADLVRALVQRHTVPMAEIRRRLFDEHAGSTELRDWVACVVRPFTDHLAQLGAPSWYARFSAQLMTEPSLRELAAAELSDAPLLHAVFDALHRCLPGLTAEAGGERDTMAMTLIVHYCAQQERSLDTAAAWAATATGLIDAIEGMYRAPMSPRG
ncbi:TetR/AcrR family transcriptional regulator [Actinoplanes sp. RD1]|uniref:TetR/AcrR family transcriptional regulator n=1 Tax=Actinoplanes sp. RD1 TaxID=3064538 RepID=UPI002741B0EA|nr:TetR/AcrR family transcriptional regulator [Actinoplanes sp. RD1]